MKSIWIQSFEIYNQTQIKICSAIIDRAIKAKFARKDLEKKKKKTESKEAGSAVTKAIKNKIVRKDCKEAKDNFDSDQYQEEIKPKEKNSHV